MNISKARIWINQPSPTTSKTSVHFLSLPKEILFEIISYATTTDDSTVLYPPSLIQLSLTCRYLHHLIHKDPWRLKTLWPRAFRSRFDTAAIVRRHLHRYIHWQYALEERCRVLYNCRNIAAHIVAMQASNAQQQELQHLQQQQQNLAQALDNIDWQLIWTIITEHDTLNIFRLLDSKVPLVAGAAFQLGCLRDREVYPVVLPILSLLVNYDFCITRIFTSPAAPHTVSRELSQFAYDFDADTLITKHYLPASSTTISSSSSIQLDTNTNHTFATLPPALLSSSSSPSSLFATKFNPAQDPLTSAFHLFFATAFASHPAPYQAIPNCSPIPLFPLVSEMFDVEFLRRYERILCSPSPRLHTIQNIYKDSGFASPGYHVSEAHLIEGEWMGYYSFLDIDDYGTNAGAAESPPTTAEDWFDGPMRLKLRIVPLEEGGEQETTTVAAMQPDPGEPFPDRHLRTCPLTRFEGTGVDNEGAFIVTGLIDDTEEGQVTWEKTYTESGETWEYAGRFILPMGLCGRWGDEQYGGPWWIWKVIPDKVAPPVATTSSTLSTSNHSSLK